MKRIRELASPPMVVACLALSVSLSGVGYAAVTLPRGSVGTPQLKNGAVTAAKVKDRSLKAGDLAVGAGFAAAFPNGRIPSGKTLRGTFAAHGQASGAGAAADAISFIAPISAPPTPHVLEFGDPSTAQCPGTLANPRAARGHLCIYVGSLENAVVAVADPVSNVLNQASRFGATVLVLSTGGAGTNFGSRGTWAVTAP
jgi:hypothetical protein